MSYRLMLGVSALLWAGLATAGSQNYLVRLERADASARADFLERNGGTLTPVSSEGNLFRWDSQQNNGMSWDSNVRYAQRNFTYRTFQNPSLEANREALLKLAANFPNEVRATDNPDIPSPGLQSTGADPLLSGAWGMFKVGADEAWKATDSGKGVIVAVTDTGVDYTHQDLINNMWRNKGETPGDGIDNDKNGYVDDLVGWDFASNDNKPYDLTMSLLEILLQGGNPGHGTHVSGVIAARHNNSVGTSGVAPLAQIMALRFITEKGQGTTEAAIKAIDYAVANGAKVINASWGGEKGEEDDDALEEAIERARDAGVIFVAAAGNGRLDPAAGTAKGFDNDTDAKPILPATFNIANIVTVAAVGDQDTLADFSNWGNKTVRLGAPGVKILSTVPGNKYQDTVIDLGSIKATWDGTSMAAPFVSGAMALAIGEAGTNDIGKIIAYVVERVTPVTALSGKVVSGGRLDLRKFAH